MTVGRASGTQAAWLMLGYAALLGLADNALPALARGMSLWQFLALRAAVALVLLRCLLALRPIDGLRPRRAPAVLLRALVHASSMTCFYGAMGFMPPAEARAALFTAPLFVVAFATIRARRPPTPIVAAAAACGFAGVTLALPGTGDDVEAGALLGLLAGALYAASNMMAMATCRDEHPLTLTATYMAVSGIVGALAMALPLPAGGSFLSHPPVWPDLRGWLLVTAHAAATLIGVALMLAAYQRGDAARTGALHYVCLPVAALWSWLLWGWRPAPVEVCGMALILAAGVIVMAEERGVLSRSARPRRQVAPPLLAWSQPPPQAAFFWPAKRS